MSIDPNKLKHNVRVRAPHAETINAHLSELSYEVAEQVSRDDLNKKRKERREMAREVAATAERRVAFDTIERVRSDVDSFYGMQQFNAAPILRGGALVAQISDVHFGCTVEGLEERKDSNVWNAEVACKRFRAFAEAIKFYAVAHAAEELVIALTGDIFDSKIGRERYDKMFNSETTASLSYFRGRDLVFQMIEDLRATELFGRIRVVGIAGNEARLYAERGHSHIMASDSWDSMLNADLAARYRGSDVECSFGVNRQVVDIQGHRMLMMHGDQGKFRPTNQTAVQSLLGQHDADFGISGHIHDTLITGKWIRSSSMMGTDHYAGDGLGLHSNAAQNLIYLRPGQRNTYTIDLQTPADDIEPYALFDYAGAFGTADNHFAA